MSSIWVHENPGPLTTYDYPVGPTLQWQPLDHTYTGQVFPHLNNLGSVNSGISVQPSRNTFEV